MTMRDQSILLDKGFRIFRRDLTRLKITEASKAGGWKLYSNHSSKVGLQRTWNIIMQDKNNLEG